MYPNLKAELVRNNILQSQVAERLNITLGTMSAKMKGTSSFSVREAQEIKAMLHEKGTDVTLDYLFQAKE